MKRPISAEWREPPVFDEAGERPDPFDPEILFPNPFPDWFEPGQAWQEPGQLDPAGDARALRYIESVQRWTGRDLNWERAFPLASVFIPSGNTGIIYGIQTHVVGARGELFNDRQGDPWSWERRYGWPLVFHLRLTPSRPISEAYVLPISGAQAAQGILPGVPYQPLPSWPDLRFGWAAPQYPLRLEVPGGSWLRLWGSVPAAPSIEPLELSEFGGRLRCLVTHYRDNPASVPLMRGAW